MAEDDRHAWERRGAFEVAEGVHRIPLPLPGDGLKAVNVYAIEQPDGVVLVDAGWALGRAREHLEEALGRLDHDLGSIRRILVTHAHRDHYELALFLREQFGPTVALGIGEKPALEHMTGPADPSDSPILHRLQRGGAGPLVEELRRAREDRDEDGLRAQWSFPDEWLHDAQSIELEGRSLRAVATPGHTQGHVVFVDESAGLLFAGDHVLPHITPSIGFEPAEADGALSDYLASLALVRAMPDHRMLPAHGPVRPTTHDRIDELLAHHEVRLRQTADQVAAGRETAYEVADGLPWTRRERAFAELDTFNQMLAVNETAAHLDVLVRRGEIGVTETGDGPDAVRHHHG